MKPVIILGAGASFDYIYKNHRTKSLDWRPPLTNEIFQPTRFGSILSKYKEVMSLFADAYRRVPHSISLETYLSEVKEKRAATDRNRQKQLVSLEFYLQELFQIITKLYGAQPVNNYQSLISQINDHGGEAYVVNFNYDNLFENEIPDINEKIDSFIAGAIKVIKLHGGCDWVYWLNPTFSPKNSSYEYLMENPWYFTMPQSQKLEVLKQRRPFGDDTHSGYHDGRKVFFSPAIAIPVSTKNFYVCPEHHIKHLTAGLRQTDRILIIGWRAKDPNLVKIIEENTSNNINVTIVSSNEAGANEVMKNLSHINNLTFTLSKQEGFSQYLMSDESEKFFQ